MPTSRRIAWYAIDVERPAVDVPGLRENLYKLRETRRMLFDRDSRPYFGDLAELAERGEEVPVLGPPDNRGLLRQLFVVGTFAVGPNVLNDGAVMMSETTMAEVFGSWWSDRPAFIAHPARAGRRCRRRAPAAQQVPGRPRRGDHHQGVRAARAALLVARDAGRLHHGPRLRDGRDDRHGVHLLRPVPDHPLLPARIRHPEEPGLRLVVLPLHDRPDRRGHHHAGFRAVLHARPRRSMASPKRPCISACRWACARWWWPWSPA